MIFNHFKRSAFSFYIQRQRDLGAMWRCRVLCTLCFWASELVAAWLDFGSCRGRFCPPGVDFVSPGLHFESFVSLWGEPEAPGALHYEKFEKVQKMKRLRSSIGSPLGHNLRPLPSKIERQAFCCAPLSVFFRERFSQRSEAWFWRKLLSQ